MTIEMVETRAVSDKAWNFSQADYSVSQWKRACLVDMGEGDPNTKARYKIPVREPNGTLNRNGAHAAAGAHGLQGVTAPAGAKRSAARALVRIYRSDLNEDPPAAILAMAGMSSTKSADESSEILVRDVTFRAKPNSDGRTLEGYAAVFDTPTRIDSWEGEFDEQIAPGAFARTLKERTPALMFEHGRHPLIGSMPLGVITTAREDANGLFISARLSDNWLIEPVRDAVRDGAVTGMSFRFSVHPDGDTWQDRPSGIPLRTLTSIDVPELGPVVFPAYEPTTVTVRSGLDRLSTDSTGHSSSGDDEGGERETGPQERAESLPYDQLILTLSWRSSQGGA